MNKKPLFKVLKALRNVIEVYIPVGCFTVLFIAFIAQIFWRYVLNRPIGWTSELISIMFVWLTLFGALYSSRTDSHIKFTMITDMLPKKVDLCFELAGNLLILVLFCLSVIPTAKFLKFMEIQKSSVMHISMTIVFGPYIIFLVGSIIYTLFDAINNIRGLAGKLPLGEGEGNIDE